MGLTSRILLFDAARATQCMMAPFTLSPPTHFDAQYSLRVAAFRDVQPLTNAAQQAVPSRPSVTVCVIPVSY